MLPPNLRVLATDSDLTPKLREMICSNGENVVYVPLASRNPLKDKDRFFAQFPRLKQRFIGSTENNNHHRSLIHNANTIVLGPGYKNLFSSRLKEEHLDQEILAWAHSGKDHLLAGRSAGMIGIGSYGDSVWPYSFGLQILDCAFFVHLDVPHHRITMELFCKNWKINAFGTNKFCALYFEGDDVTATKVRNYESSGRVKDYECYVNENGLATLWSESRFSQHQFIEEISE